MKIQLALACVLFLVFNFEAFSQKSDTKNNAIDIVKIYEKVLEDGYESLQIYKTLAKTTYERRQYADARKWFEKWFEMESSPERFAYLSFARTLEALNETDLAKKYFDLYESKKPN
jgi:tetratricopeptide (TPR) repeat protein